ncbi:MAG: hypothetical protein VX498_10155 [Myxococcota bacterium]|nr:hypothetical protein [Myxococcota bacterium]
MLLSPGLHAEESGLAIGSLVAKPSVSIDAVYDSNVFRTAQEPEADFGLQLKPKFSIVYPGDNFRWELDAWYRFFNYFNLGGSSHDVLRTFTDFGLSTTLDANRKGKLGFVFAPEFSNQRSARGADTGDGDGSDLAHEFSVGTPIGFRIRPTQAFHVNVDGGWKWVRSYYPDQVFDTNPLILGNSHDVGGSLGLDWRFFPRSHLLIDGGVGHVFQGEVDDGVVRHAPALESTYWRAWVGLRGDVTSKLSLMGQVGYGNIYFGEENSDENLSGVDGLLGRAEFALRPSLTQRIAFGFQRDFYFRYFANRIMDTQAYVKYKGLIGGRLALLADFTYIYRVLKSDDSDSRSTSRWEHQWGAGIGAEIMIQEWMHVTVRYRFSAVNPSETSEGEYIDNRVNLGLVFGFR